VVGYRKGGLVSRKQIPSLAEKLRIARARKALSLRKAAALAGVDMHSISNAERGLTTPYDSTLLKLAEVYEVDVAELMEAKLGRPLAEDTALAGKADAPSPKGRRLFQFEWRRYLQELGDRELTRGEFSEEAKRMIDHAYRDLPHVPHDQLFDDYSWALDQYLEKYGQLG